MAPPRKDAAGKAAAAVAPTTTTTTTAVVPLTREALDELENKRDAFVEAMNTLSYAAKTAARTGYEYFNILASASNASFPPSAGQPTSAPLSSVAGIAAGASTAAIPYPTLNGFTPVNFNAHVRSQSVAPEPRGRPIAIAPLISAAPVPVEENRVEEPAVVGEGGKKKRKRGGAATAAAATDASATTPATTTTTAGKKERKAAAKDKDPNEPKKPISAYFQFTAAARPIIKEDMGANITAKEIITEAANRWQALPADEKKVWLAQHHKQMVKWYQDLNAYRLAKGVALETVPEQYRPGAKPPSFSAEDTPPQPPTVEGEENEENHQDEPVAEEEAEEEEEEAPATPPPPPKRSRNTPKNSKVNGTPAASTTKRGKGPGRPPAVPATPAAAEVTATPDSTKRRRAPTMKAKEAREAVKEKTSRTTKASANANTNNTELAAEKQVLQEQGDGAANEGQGGEGDEEQHSITVGGAGKGGEKEKEKEKEKKKEKEKEKEKEKAETTTEKKKDKRRRKGKSDD